MNDYVGVMINAIKYHYWGKIYMLYKYFLLG